MLFVFSFEPSSEWGLNVTMWKLWGPVMFANVKENKWFAVQVVRLVPEGVHIHRLSPVVWLWKWRSKYLKGEINVERAHPRQFKVRIQSAKMTSAASVAEPAKTAPRAPPVGQWKKRGKNPARQARANVWARRKRMVGSFFMNIGFE